jgi:hypothetical protein
VVVLTGHSSLSTHPHHCSTFLASSSLKSGKVFISALRSRPSPSHHDDNFIFDGEMPNRGGDILTCLTSASSGAVFRRVPSHKAHVALQRRLRWRSGEDHRVHIRSDRDKGSNHLKYPTDTRTTRLFSPSSHRRRWLSSGALKDDKKIAMFRVYHSGCRFPTERTQVGE